jgi:hypothetical protein
LLSACYNPFNGSVNKPFSLWEFNRVSNGVLVYYGSTALNPYNNPSLVAFYSPIQKHVPASWLVPDSPAPLLWEYHYLVTHPKIKDGSQQFGDTSWGNGQVYSARLLDVMKQDHFSPSEIGGVNPPGWSHFVAPKTPVNPIVPPPVGDPALFAPNTVMAQWQWVPSVAANVEIWHSIQGRYYNNYPAHKGYGILLSGFMDQGYLQPILKTFTGSWIAFPPGWSRIDAMAPLMALAHHDPKAWATERLYIAPPTVPGIRYSADTQAALTIQGINPGTLGLLPYPPNVHSITKATATWLVQHHWGSVLTQYLTHHPKIQAALRADHIPGLA